VNASEDFLATAHGGPVTHLLSAEGPRVTDKQSLRAELRQRRLAHDASISPGLRALLFHRPPAALLEIIPQDSAIGVYHPIPGEAPPLGYARWFAEAGHPVALPWFARRGDSMRFKLWDNPFDDSGLVPDPYGAMQPPAEAEDVDIDVAFVPLLGFTREGHRLGQGGGHYDRLLTAHPEIVPIGLAWDCQLLDALPLEEHDRPLRGVITPTRFYGPFDAN
jgi:5-formyltetrahydrofolate cyclo-ligase